MTKAAAVTPEADAKPPKKSKSKSKKGKGKEKKPKGKKPILPTGPQHPKLGYKWICYACDAKFYDLLKEAPLCPKCGVDQRERPPELPKQSSDAPKAKIVRPMAQLLDDEEPVPSREEDDVKKVTTPAEEMFDDTEADEGGLDIDDDSAPDEGVDPPDIDV